MFRSDFQKTRPASIAWAASAVFVLLYLWFPAPVMASICGAHMAKYEKQYRLPRNILNAIGLTESGHIDPETKKFVPWPWTIYSEGRGRYHDSKQAAISDVEALKRRGVKNIDVGCMQVNLKYHPDAFANLQQAFDPETNVAYAALFLSKLREEHKSWGKSIARYHSATKDRGERYVQKVMKNWNSARKLNVALVRRDARARFIKRRSDSVARRQIAANKRQALARRFTRERNSVNKFRYLRRRKRNPNIVIHRKR